ncbi:hypothetical protein MSP8887_02626 [Marinomonas spartinae]|uniref:DUF4879 domain-containing protein n=1 Tax=Marinomonas spartinae TaxID=1792290 RepID=A0A1A8TCP4_9GAMM|nr:DUF4879 domain-containing protein [Marinomonas spartinae]SBS30528.1 hypothetical protein MSP8886_01843 [Marinomonas spartinae]SBS36546.1 hypothetical protein MSP8887_02626 [Marinomonas spartinae]
MKIKKTLLVSMMMSGACSMSAIAADVEGGIVKKAPSQTISLPSNLLSIDPSALSAVRPELAPLGNATPKAAAEGISYFEIAGIESSKYPFEGVSPNQTSTIQDHGGAKLVVYVWQRGYGNVYDATMNGVSKRASSEYRCGYDLHRCSSGEIVTGWLHSFDFSGQGLESGQFKASSYSTSYPTGLWSDSITIR